MSAPYNARWAIGVGFATIAVTFGGVFGWAATAPIASAVIAPGLVAVEGKRKQVQHLEGGIVRHIAIADGERVAAGQLLMRLDDTRARASLGIVQAALDVARVLEARLIAERDGASIRFPNPLIARQDDPTLAQMMRAQQTLFEARRASLLGQQEILQQRVAQYEKEIAGLTAQQTALEQQIVFVEDELTGLRELFQKEIATKPKLLSLEREAARLNGSRGERIAAIARAQITIGGTRLEILQMERTFRESVAKEIRDVQAQIADLEERVIAAKSTLEYIEIRAPAAGIVVGLNAHTIGGVIKAGETVLEIVPDSERLVIEVQVLPNDINDVAVGLKTEVRLTSFKQRTTPTLQGNVTYVSADRLTDQRTGQPYYLARIALADGEVNLLAPLALQPGMPAEAMIKSRERTALEYLVQPLADTMARTWREN